ncbi:TPA: hypothetical protein EYO57_05180 [Candidatus Poribacteria bacterium]|nr:hypothetical protein [Candidatus Poribacteria bacterium]
MINLSDGGSLMKVLATFPLIVFLTHRPSNSTAQLGGGGIMVGALSLTVLIRPSFMMTTNLTLTQPI